MENSEFNDTNNSLEKISVLKKRKEHISQQLQTYRFALWGWVIFSIVGAFFSYRYVLNNAPMTNYNPNLIGNLIFGALAGSMLYAYLIGVIRFILNSNLRKVEIELVKLGSIELRESIDQDFFTKLVKLNFKYLDQYYLQTQEQADKSFRLTAFAAIFGLVIIVIGVIMMYSGKTEPAYVTTASGVISEFIAAIFFYLYNKTILRMSRYHQKLVITQNISLALKITNEMGNESKNKAFEMLIDRLTTDVNKHLTESKEN